MRSYFICNWMVIVVLLAQQATAQPPRDHFRQLDDVWPTPDNVRRPSGAPGSEYWQQKVDYVIKAEIDDQRQVLSGKEKITYLNNSPDVLEYLWLQLDQNRYERNSEEWLTKPAPSMDELSYKGLRSFLYRERFDGGHKITAVKDAEGANLKYSIIRTMMRVELPKPIARGESTTLQVEWNFKIADAGSTKVRGGYEHFPDDGNYIYTIAQWYPRLCAYTDYHGWQNRQSLGAEFALEFGDFDVSITVPNDHIVAATGELANADEVLTETQRNRLQQAKTSNRPVYIVTADEATSNERSAAGGRKSWRFVASKVRDFSFASSRKFLWDAQGFDLNGRSVMAMSFWPKEGQPLWGKYSTASVIHAVKSYSKFTFDYPYPVIISVNGAVRGMEYPMITFQSPRPEKDGTYSEATKNGLISVIIHEVGHNWFPMVVNSDERQWRWMDEGLNSFVQLLAEQEWQDFYPSRILNPDRRKRFYDYLKTENKRPIMSAADNLIDGGHTAYSKPTLALMVLRESVLGREQFDFAFKRYAKRWQFKRPTPFDFFRTMEESTGRDLDWFWRGWFYSTEYVDISVANLRRFRLESPSPDAVQQKRREKKAAQKKPLIVQRNSGIPKRIQKGDLQDFYSSFDEFSVLPEDRKKYQELLEKLEPFEKQLLDTRGNFYMVDFENVGGVVMPLLLEIKHSDGSTRQIRIPAEVWRLTDRKVSKLIYTDKEIVSVTLDPNDETADQDRTNNSFPRKPGSQPFKLKKDDKKKNPMQQLNAN